MVSQAMPPDQAAWARWLAGVDGLAEIVRGLDAALVLSSPLLCLAFQGRPVSMLLRSAFAAGYAEGKGVTP